MFNLEYIIKCSTNVVFVCILILQCRVTPVGEVTLATVLKCHLRLVLS